MCIRDRPPTAPAPTLWRPLAKPLPQQQSCPNDKPSAHHRLPDRGHHLSLIHISEPTRLALI
eukprot:6494967-Alexandrium_andersonii.AAC.1